MEIKEKLTQYEDLKREAKRLAERIEKIEEKDPTVADVVQNGYKGRLVIHGFDNIKAYRLEKLKKVLKKRYDKCLQLQAEIEEYISNIERSDIRQIFEHRYIDNLKWFEIAHVMNFKNEDAPRKKHDRFLEKNA